MHCCSCSVATHRQRALYTGAPLDAAAQRPESFDRIGQLGKERKRRREHANEHNGEKERDNMVGRTKVGRRIEKH